MSRRDSTKFSPSDIDEVKQDDLISMWLEHVQSSFYPIQYEDKSLYLDKGQVNALRSYASDPHTFREEVADLVHRNTTLQSGDHLFMRLVANANNENKKDQLLLERSGDFILETANAKNKVHGVAFLLDYTRRWSSRVENFSGAIQGEVPLVFASFQFFCSGPMLFLTIGLQIYLIVWQLVAVIFVGALTADMYHNLGLLVAVILGSYVVKGTFGSAAAFEKVTELFDQKIQQSKKDDTMKSNEADQENTIEIRNVINNNKAENDIATAEDDVDTRHSVYFNPVSKIPKNFVQKISAFLHALLSDALSLQVPIREKSATGRKVRSNGLVESRGFMEVLDVATEYLKLMSSKHAGFKARPYSTYLLRAVYVIVPAFTTYSIIESWVALGSCHRHHHYGFSSSSQSCNILNFNASYSLGYSLSWLGTVLGILNLAVSFSILMFLSWID